jgi:hypothetical protein
MRFAALDVYPKTLAEFRQRTTSGAIVSITCAALILLLTIVEVADFVMVTTDDHLFVDSTRGSTLRINLNISFPALPCSTLTLDTLDVSGNHAPDLMRHVTKSRLDKDGRRLTTVLEPHGGGDGAPGRRPLSVEHGPNLVPALRALRQDAMLSSLLALLQPQVCLETSAYRLAPTVHRPHAPRKHLRRERRASGWVDSPFAAPGLRGQGGHR